MPIHHIAGDIGGIEMQEVPQTQFVPLPEVLCLVISQLNRIGHPATLDTVADEIAHEYPGMAVPGPVRYRTIASTTVSH
jgi:hypothetical protein